MIVSDASVAVALLLRAEPTAGRVWRRLAGEDGIHAPSVLDLEVVNALRRLARGGEVSVARASWAVQELSLLNFRRYGHEPLMPRVWALRDNLSAYDAAYVALAEALHASLLTTDSRLASAAGPRCPVEPFA